MTDDKLNTSLSANNTIMAKTDLLRSTDQIYNTIHLTLRMTSAQVVKTSTVTHNSSFQNFPHPDDHTTRTNEAFLAFLALKSLVKKYACHSRLWKRKFQTD